MVGILRPRKIAGMAAEAHSRCARKSISLVALNARQTGVPARQRKACDLRVIEAGPLPDIHVVAVFAGLGQFGGHVVQRSCGLKILEMTRDALRAEPRIDASRGALMASIAGDSRVCAEKREPVVVLLDGRDRHVPAPHRVTFLAIRAELPPVQIRMTVRAAGRRLREHQVHMASLARYVLVETKQRKSGLSGVIELRLSADWLPRGCRMAVLAGHAQFAVRVRDAAAHGVLRRQGYGRCGYGYGHKQPLHMPQSPASGWVS
jgi:hypothetical protein